MPAAGERRRTRGDRGRGGLPALLVLRRSPAPRIADRRLSIAAHLDRGRGLRPVRPRAHRQPGDGPGVRRGRNLAADPSAVRPDRLPPRSLGPKGLRIRRRRPRLVPDLLIPHPTDRISLLSEEIEGPRILGMAPTVSRLPSGPYAPSWRRPAQPRGSRTDVDPSALPREYPRCSTPRAAWFDTRPRAHPGALRRRSSNFCSDRPRVATLHDLAGRSTCPSTASAAPRDVPLSGPTALPRRLTATVRGGKPD